MKNYIQFLIISSIILFSGCEDIVTEKPIDFLVPGNFPTTEKDALAATTAAYTRLHSSIISFYYAFNPSDISYQGQHNMRPVSWFIGLTAENGDATVMWQRNYQGVSLANTVINLVPEVSMPDETLKARLIGEAKFLRAFYYFELVRVYGGVPILTDLANPSELEGITRNSVNEVYALIKSDLHEAIPVLPDEYQDSDKGRATKWAATALLARVHLTLGEWEEAIARSEEVIRSGFYGLAKDYNSLWGQEAEYILLPGLHGGLVNENVFDIQFQQDERRDFKQSWTGSRDSEIVGGVNAVGGGWENMMPTVDYLAMFEEGDLRKNISYMTELNGNVLESPRTPGAGPISGKYLNPNGDPPKSNNGSQNTYVIRYADVLLMRAEAENELNGPDGAYEYINLVRERAGLPPLQGLSQSEFRAALRKERATELGFEGHRKFDLLRWDIFVETIRNAKDEHLSIPASNIQEHNVLMPIPSREIEISKGSLTQNPGY